MSQQLSSQLVLRPVSIVPATLTFAFVAHGLEPLFSVCCLTSGVSARVTAVILATWVAICADCSDHAHTGIGVARLGAVALSWLFDEPRSARVTTGIVCWQ